MKLKATWIAMMIGISVSMIGTPKHAKAQQSEVGPGMEENLQYLNDELQSSRRELKTLKEGSTKFLLSGYGFGGFEKIENQPSSFNAGFNPIFLWKQGDRILAEVEFEVELVGGETELALEYADFTYIVNDYLTIGVGQFLSPANFFIERLHPAWINKLPDAPLAVGSGALLPGTQLGIQVRGAIPLAPVKLEYALYASNGPSLSVSGPTAGQLEFDNFPDANEGKAVGGRVGIFPFPFVELGYAFEYARIQPEGFGISDTDLVIHVVDFNLGRDFDLIRGSVDLRGQWVWSDTGSYAIGFIAFSNDRNGGYGQLAYRPSQINLPIVKDLELIGRYDRLDLPAGAPTNTDRQRWTIGLDCWISPSLVVKTAYQFDQRDTLGGSPNPDTHAFRAQVALGF